MEKVINYFKENFKSELLNQKIRVYGWQYEYEHNLVSSICGYLFEEFKTIENIAPLTNDNREGKVRPKYYITVHDTGDASSDHNAKFWSETVKIQDWELGRYGASYQYVVGNDGTYHNIPDEEIAYHAGDGTSGHYSLCVTDIKGENSSPIVTISEDGYYEIDGIKSIVRAPRAYKEKNGEVILDRIAKTSDINDQGVLCVLRNGKYYIGETYFNATYEKICNRGGNNNSVGIESCVNENTDIYLTWQRTAKLVAKLLLENNLTIKDVKQHHYFSGKNCPQTMRENNLWEHFLWLVKFESDILEFINQGYKIEFECLDKRVQKNGRIVLDDNLSDIVFNIRISKNDKEVREKFVLKVK